MAMANSNNGANNSYANEKPAVTPGDPEFANDPASGGFFTADYKKHEDLKLMLDSNKDGLKLEAMKRIIGMVAKGKDASELFAAVVKNVVSRNIEVKKLVYVYLVRYAEEQQDLALLSISTFQRALKDPNQLIRASALRVLSSIRVPVIVPIMMLAIKDCVSDMSPYVRKTVAHAIPKLYSLDPESKSQLILVIEKLLSDKTTLVVGSAVMAFEEVCPDRIDLVHKNYRKLCNLLVDVEEWGQVVIIGMLTRYGRTQFVDPNSELAGDGDSGAERPFYDTDEEEREGNADKREKKAVSSYQMDSDHRLLLRNAKPLLQSRNTAVVVAVVQLYYHLAPRSEVGIVAKALIRLLRNHREVQSIVLSNIATISTRRKDMFEPYLKSFFVRSSDPTHIKQLKLDILTNLATETNIMVILREFQTYVKSADKDFVASTIQSIGRVASCIDDVTDTCLAGLVQLMSNQTESVVAESVVVIKKLLQMRPNEHKDIIGHMARLVDSITVPQARASILWLLGEYSERVPRIAPDVLRKMAKTFPQEEDIVKLQTMNLATKLCLTNPKQTRLLCQYVLNLAKYDQNYDIRDRARFMRQLVFPPGDKETLLSKHARKIFMSSKPAPVLESKYHDRDNYQLGSLSLFINSAAQGYNDLPPFPLTAPDPTVRNVDVQMPWSTEPKDQWDTRSKPTTDSKKGKQKDMKSFYSSEDETSEAEEAGAEREEEGSSSSSSSSGDSSSGEDESEVSDTSKADSEKKVKTKELAMKKKEVKAAHTVRALSESTTEAKSDSQTESGSSSESDNSSQDERQKIGEKMRVAPGQTTEKKKSNVDLLLDLDNLDISNGVGPVMQPSMLLPQSSSSSALAVTSQSFKLGRDYTVVKFPVVDCGLERELMNRLVGLGLRVSFRFTRTVNIYSDRMTTVDLRMTNEGEEQLDNIRIGNKSYGPGVEIHEFPPLESLAPGASSTVQIGIDFNETTQAAQFQLCHDGGLAHVVSIKATIGELLQAINMNELDFQTEQGKLKGMNESGANIALSGDLANNKKALVKRVYETANCKEVANLNENDTVIRFAAYTVSTKSLALITVQPMVNARVALTVNCEKIVVGSMLIKELKTALS